MGAVTRAFRNISRRKMRALLVIIALGFSMAIMISIPAGIVANQQSTQTLTQNLGDTMTNMQGQINQTMTLIECGQTSSFTPGGFGFGGPPESGGVSGAGESVLDENIMYSVSSIQGVKAVVPFLQQSKGENTTVTRFGRTFTFLRADYTIIGIPLNSSLIENYPILPTNITVGRNLKEGDSGVVLLSENNTGFFGVSVGDEVNILGTNFEVVGVHGSSGFMDTRNLYMNISDAQVLTNLTGQISRFDVYADSNDDVGQIASQIASMYPELSITSYKDRLTQLQNMQTMYTETLTNAQSTLSQTQTTATQEIVISVVATSLIVLFMMLYTVRERTKEIGTLKALGFSNGNVMGQFMLEGTMLSFIAGIVGIAIGSIGAPALSGLLLPHINMFGSRGRFDFGGPTAGSLTSGAASVAPDPQIMLLALGLAVMLGALGSLYPAWRASRIRPAEAMRYE